jgi:NAD(P)-dependent dehydrogenase (short-subunit alcohol dehydrogenase family)
MYPSVIKTDGGHWDNASQEHIKKYLDQRVPTRRFQTVEEFASVVAFYCGEQASACHGAIVSVDQGQSRHYSAHNYL